MCFDSLGHKESDTTDQLNLTERWYFIFVPDLLTSVVNVYFLLAVFITCFWCPVFSSSTIIYP